MNGSESVKESSSRDAQGHPASFCSSKILPAGVGAAVVKHPAVAWLYGTAAVTL